MNLAISKLGWLIPTAMLAVTLALLATTFLTFAPPKVEKLYFYSCEWLESPPGEITEVRLYIKNTGVDELIVKEIWINGTLLGSTEWESFPCMRFQAGDEGAVSITPSLIVFKEGMTYQFSIGTAEGNSFSYTATAETDYQHGEAGPILVKENVRYYTVGSTQNMTEFTLRNTGTANGKILSVYWSKSSFATTSKLITAEYTMVPSTGVVSPESSIVIIIKWGVSGGTITDTEWVSGTTYYYKFITDAGQTYEYAEKAP